MKNTNSIPIHFITGLMCLNINEEKDRFSQEVDILLDYLTFIKYIENFRRQRDIDCNKFNAMLGQPNSVEIPQNIKDERLSRRLKTLKGQKKLGHWLSDKLPKDVEYIKTKEYQQKSQLQKEYVDKILRIKRWIDKRLTMNDFYKIRRRFKLSETWDYPLMEYILTGRMCKPCSRSNVSLVGLPRHKRRLFISCTWDASIDDIRDVWGRVKENQKMLPDSGKRNPIIFVEDGKLKIEVYKDTTIEDIRRNWVTVEGKQKTLPEYKSKLYRCKRNLERDKKISEWTKEGKKEKGIGKQLEEEYPDLIINLETIRKARERYRKRLIK